MAKDIENILTIKINGKEVQSRPFAFEDYADMQDKHLRGYSGACKLCYGVLISIFKGTAANKEYIDTMSIAEKDMLCRKLLDIYLNTISEVNELIKNQ